MWQHNYEPIAGSLGISALFAAIPIVVLFLMLGVFRKPAWMSALSALASAVLVSLLVYGMPAQTAVSATRSQYICLGSTFFDTGLANL